MTKILVALYEQAEQAQQTARQLATLGIAQREISVLSSQSGSTTAGCSATPSPARSWSASWRNSASRRTRPSSMLRAWSMVSVSFWPGSRTIAPKRPVR